MVLDLVLIGTLIGANPIAVPAFIVLLDSKGGVRKGAAFVFGWLFSLAAVIALTFLVTGNAPPKPGSPSSIAATTFKLAAGVVLLLVALRQQLRKGKPKKPKKTPKWQAHVDDLSPWFALAIGALIQPWGMVGIGVATLTQAQLTNAGTYLVVVGYCLLASWSYILMEVYAGFRPDKTKAMLASLRDWTQRHTDQLIIIGSLVAGFYLVGKSAYLLAT